MKLTKDQLQKLILSGIGFVILLYVYNSFFLGPLNKSRNAMLAQIDDLQHKVATSKSEMHKATMLEEQAKTATARFAALKGLSPEGAPIAWFPPLMKTFFASQRIDKTTARLDSNADFKQAELSAWTKYTWLIDLPQADFDSVGQAVAELENTQPLLSIGRLSIRATAEDPQFQQVSILSTIAIVKR